MHTRFSTFCFLLVAFLNLIPPASFAGTAAPGTLGALKDSVQKILIHHKVEGVGLALVNRDSVIWAGGAGKADIKTGKDVSANTLFRIGSITKSFVALAVLKLVEEGKLDLDAKLKDLAPEIQFENPWESTNPVTLTELLEHTAGFDDMHVREVKNFKDSPDLPMEKVLKLDPSSRNVRWKPGTRMAYSNPGYAVVGYIIEKATGMRFEDYIEQVLMKPIGMVNASAHYTPYVKENIAQGYVNGPVKYEFLYLRPAGCIHASPHEMGLFVKFFLNQCRADSTQILSPELLHRMETPTTSLGAKAGLTTGYGLANYSEFENGFIARGHDGGVDGFISTFRYIPEAGLGYVILGNNTSSAGRKAFGDIKKVVVSYLLQHLPHPKGTSYSIHRETLRQYTGYYEAGNPRMQLTAVIDYLLGGKKVILRNDSLYVAGIMGKEKKALIPVSNNLFRTSEESAASMVFTKNDEGIAVLAGGMDYYEKAPAWKPYLNFFLLGTGLLLMLSIIPFTLVWGVIKVFGGLKLVKRYKVRLVPLLPALCCLLSIAVAMNINGPEDLDGIGFKNFSLFTLSWLAAITAFWGGIVVLKSYRTPVNKWLRMYLLCVSLANIGLVIFLGKWGFIGIMLW